MASTAATVELPADPLQREALLATLMAPGDTPDWPDLAALRAALVGEHPAWQQQAACRGAGVDFWFPERGAPPQHLAIAVATCQICPVQRECERLAEGDPGLVGIWAGRSNVNRHRRSRRRQPDAA